MKRKIKKTAIGICLLVLALLIVYPTVVTIADSFMSVREIEIQYGKVFTGTDAEDNSNGFRAERTLVKLIPDIISLKQYSKILFQSPDYLFKFWNSFILTVPIVILQLVIALMAAYGFSRCKGRIKEIIFFAYIILMLLPYQVTLVPNYLVSKWLHLLGGRGAIIIPAVFSPFAVFLLTKGMNRIPIECYDAARLDGANEMNMFTRICVPLCKNIVTSVGMLIFFDYWNMVEQPILMLDNSDKYPLSIFLSQINQGEIGIAFAASVLYMIPCLLIFLYGSETLIEGISFSSDGIKG